MPPFESIVVAFDGSEPSVRAVNVALDLASRFHSRVTLLSVVPPPAPAYTGIATPPTVELEDMERPFLEAADLQKARLEKAGIPHVRVELRRGSPGREILQFLEDRPPDLLVIGARGLSELGRVFLGSVSDLVVHHAHCPILVVRSPASR
jgi:nucleotide-binding universal stress UspA family protein